MIVTTGGRGSASSEASMPACSASSTWSAFSTLAMWPISSTTSTAVSWSTGWLIVAMTPMLSIVFMTSLDLTAIRWASSATVIVSPIATSCCTRLRRQLEPMLAVRAGSSGTPPRLRPRAALLVPCRQPAGDVQLLAAVLGVLVVFGGLARFLLAGAPLLLRLFACLLLGIAARLLLGLALGILFGRAALGFFALPALLVALLHFAAGQLLRGRLLGALGFALADPATSCATRACSSRTSRLM